MARFWLGYHDGRRVTKSDNRPPAMRTADHNNIRIGTYGGDLLRVFLPDPVISTFCSGERCKMAAGDNSSHNANAAAVEAGYQLEKAPTAPWLRAGWFRGSGDSNTTDGTHNTFFQVLPTPRVYARFPFYNLMNSTDEFAQVIDKPVKRLALRSDLHWLQLTSGKTIWYQGGGAYDNKVFGFTGRPGNGHSSFASVFDASADWQTTKNVAINFYYAHAWGKAWLGDLSSGSQCPIRICRACLSVGLRTERGVKIGQTCPN